jgi:hypothetical protein
MVKGDPLQAAHVASSISRNGLEVNQSFIGVAAWGYFRTKVGLVIFSVSGAVK